MQKRQPDGTTVLAGSSELDFGALLRRAYPALLVVGVWMVCHPYAGIIDDARLYIVQAFHLLEPDVFDRDFFFAFGSQGDFTLFSFVFAPLVRIFGPSAAAMIVVAVSHAVWLSGATALALRLAPTRVAALVGLVVVAAMPSFYGGTRVFEFGEGFATPRPLVEGFSLWALWAMTHRRLLTAALLAAAGGLLHPLVCMTVLCVGFTFLVFGDRRWLLAGFVGGAAVVAAACFGIPPFDRILQTMDPEWLAIVEVREKYLFPAQWSSADWSSLGFASALALSGAAMLAGWRQHLVLAATLAGLLGVLATHIGADLLDNLFIIQIQLWRTLWLLHLFAFLGAGILFVRLWRLDGDGFALIALILFSWVLDQILYPVWGAALGVLTLGFAVLRLRGALPPLPPAVQIAGVSLAAITTVFLASSRILYTTSQLAALPDDIRLSDVLGTVTLIDIAVVVATVFGLSHFAPRVARSLLPAALLLLVGGGAAGWDRSHIWSRSPPIPYPLDGAEALLPPDAQVYWEGDARGAWLSLHRPSYFSLAQGGGIEYNRRTALIYRDRARIVEPLVGRDLIDVYRVRNIGPPPLPPLTRDMLVETCLSDRALTAMVLSREVPGVYAAAWDLPRPVYEWLSILRGVERPPVRRVYLYRCADLV